MKKLTLLLFMSFNLFANDILVKVDNDIKIDSWSDDSAFFNPNNSFNQKDTHKFVLCVLQKNEIDHLLLCIENKTNKTFGSNIKGSYIDDKTFIPEENFISLKEMVVKVQ